MPSVSPAPGCSAGADHAERDRRVEDLRRAVDAILTGRARKVVASDTARTVSNVAQMARTSRFRVVADDGRVVVRWSVAMSEERFDRIELERLAKRLRESEATIEKLTLKLDELARFSVSVDERVEELSESVADLRSSNPDASAKASDRSLDRMLRQGVEFRQERRASLLRR